MPSTVTRSMNATCPAPPLQTASAPRRGACMSSPTTQPAASAWSYQYRALPFQFTPGAGATASKRRAACVVHWPPLPSRVLANPLCGLVSRSSTSQSPAASAPRGTSSVSGAAAASGASARARFLLRGHWLRGNGRHDSAGACRRRPVVARTGGA